MDFAQLDEHRRALSKGHELWQFNLLKPQGLLQFVRDRGINLFNEETVKGLWHAGLLRADVVVSPAKLKMPSLTLAAEEHGTMYYCDERRVAHRPGGYGGILSQAQKSDLDVELYFHPFRLYVLYHVERVFQSRTTPTQFLLNPDGLVRLAQSDIEDLTRWTSGEKCAELFERWNRIAELAIVLEPVTYSYVFQSVRWGSRDSRESIEEKRNAHRQRVKSLLLNAEETIREYRQNLCINAETLDHNKLIHVLLRLVKASERLRLRSSLGAAIMLTSMAEVIRRAAEDATGTHLPEEDQLGFGQWMDGARKRIYGSERILDAPRKVRREFLTHIGLDAGVKVRVYVEGETELAALVSAVGSGAGAEFVNLRGQFIERRGRGLQFADSLKSDKDARIFSAVLLDGDNTDNVRAVKKAARDGDFFGRFFIATPDFELANFTSDELVDATLKLPGLEKDRLPARGEISVAANSARSGKEFIKAMRSVGLEHIDKGADWGEVLMSFALDNQVFPSGHRLAGKTRPIVDAAMFIDRARDVQYAISHDAYVVDPETGELHAK